MSVGKEIEKVRKSMGMSLDDVATMAGLSKGTVWRTEKGQNDPGISTLRGIAGALCVSVSSLLDPKDTEVALTIQERRVILAMRTED